MRRGVAALCLALVSCERCRSARVEPAPPTAAPADATASVPGWLKGQLHAHSSASDDSKTRPENVHRWYEARGYDFVVFTDHNTITDTTDTTKTLTIPGVELTRNLTRCKPPAPQGCALHMNVLFVEGAEAGPDRLDLGEVTSLERRDIYRTELERARSLRGLPMLNHPNMLYGASDPTLVAELAGRGISLLEVANQSWDANNDGDPQHPSTEALWDAVLARRLTMYAVATDDAHHYDDATRMREDGEHPFPGDLGFVMVRASKDAPSLRAAIARGDFYASTGVLLSELEQRPGGISIATPGRVRFEAIAQGRVIATATGTRFDATLGPDDGPYVRVRVTRDDGARAWTQPAFR